MYAYVKDRHSLVMWPDCTQQALPAVNFCIQTLYLQCRATNGYLSKLQPNTFPSFVIWNKLLQILLKSALKCTHDYLSMRKLSSLINCQPSVRRPIKWRTASTLTCFLLNTIVTAAQLYTWGKLTTSCGYWESDLVHFWGTATVSSKTLINAAAVLLLHEWNTWNEWKHSSYIKILSHWLFVTFLTPSRHLHLYTAVSLLLLRRLVKSITDYFSK